jgi:hypothetical protein
MTSLPAGYPPLPCKVLSVKPFSAWAIVRGGKDVENRARRTNYRGRVLVHASNYRSRAELEADFARVRALCPSVPMEVDAGGIIGSVEIVQVLGPEVEGRCRGWALPGKCHWLLTNPRTLPYWECLGALGIWTLKEG